MEKEILSIIKKINKDAVITSNEMDLLNTEVLDSLGIAQLIAELEEEYDIEIDAEDIIPENFQNINKIAALVQKTKKDR